MAYTVSPSARAHGGGRPTRSTTRSACRHPAQRRTPYTLSQTPKVLLNPQALHGSKPNAGQLPACPRKRASHRSPPRLVGPEVLVAGLVDGAGVAQHVLEQRALQAGQTDAVHAVHGRAVQYSGGSTTSGAATGFGLMGRSCDCRRSDAIAATTAAAPIRAPTAPTAAPPPHTHPHPSALRPAALPLTNLHPSPPLHPSLPPKILKPSNPHRVRLCLELRGRRAQPQVDGKGAAGGVVDGGQPHKAGLVLQAGEGQKGKGERGTSGRTTP